MAAPFW